MRVAHVITRMILGGAQENTLYNCIDLMRLYQDEVLLITGPPEGPEGSLIESAAGQGVRIEIIPELCRAIHLRNDFKAFGKLKKILKEFQPDVVHTHSAKAGILGRIAAAELKIPAIVHTVHGAPFYAEQGKVARTFSIACEKFAATKCHAMISVADAMTDKMVEAKIAPREKFTTILSGMEIEPFLNAEQHRAQVREEFGFQEDQIVIGKIARLFHLKGHEFVIQAAKKVITQHSNVRFLFVGSGILEVELKQQIDQAGLSEFFTFTGLVEPTRIPKLIAAMDILVHTSLREGLARTLPQALLVGRPVISFDLDGASQVVIPNQTGILVPAKDGDGLSQAMIELIEDPEKRKRFGKEGQAMCAELFSHQKMTEQIRNLYQQLLEKRAGQGSS